MNAPQRRKEWQEFKQWCDDRHLKAFPVHPWTLSAYMLWLDANRRYRTIHKRLDVIARVHVRACMKAPDTDRLVIRTLAAIEERRNPDQNALFDGEELLEPKRAPLAEQDMPVPGARRLLSQTPPLVSRRPQADLS